MLIGLVTKLKKKSNRTGKNIASAGNRTCHARVVGEHFTTENKISNIFGNNGFSAINRFCHCANRAVKLNSKLVFSRGHNITFISAFPADFHINGLEEIAPEGLVTYVRNYMSFDLVGARMRGEDQMPVKDVLRYGYEVGYLEMGCRRLRTRGVTMTS